ncbi:MAG TPA: type II toxin-antitoxin system Phd/YefM family antitoxin [Candidatus Hydrogenedentes bacterium]|nr:MAG: Antitoxin RelJ [Candidatus Hydrogenedentes bacterium ADurb.Bin101]HOC70628.1 type II toxin-antitoxin system Phd/YefM family antitoxin [Candidatus Hydrogenedentota bacterium]HQN02170.1 type II toxin-antitoxin system Phd/YefM family antitoxin [Candidatus Hydrogenedentota bacterium]
MNSISTDMAQDNLSALIEQVAQSHEPIQIVSGVRSALLVAEEDWQSIQETLYLVSIPFLRESILEGIKTPVEECSEDPGW